MASIQVTQRKNQHKEANEEDRVWMNIGALGTHLSIKLTEPQEPESMPIHAIGRRKTGGRTEAAGRLHNISQVKFDGLVFATRRLTSSDELAAKAKEHKRAEESKSHVKLKCEYHKSLISKTKTYQEHIANGTKTEEEMFEGLHNTEACLAFQQPYIRCTKHSAGPPGIIQIYETDDPAVSKKRWEQAADLINKRIADDGDRVMCVFNSTEFGHDMHSADGYVAYVDLHLDAHGDAMGPNQ